MNRRIGLSIIVLTILLVGFIPGDNDLLFRINKSIELYGRVYREAAINYVDDINPEELMEAGIEGMLSVLDPYTVYLDDTHQNDIDLITKGKYGGIGATIGIRNDVVTVVDLIEGYSAQRQGIQIGDAIIEIDNVKITKDNYANLGSLMKGDPGSTLIMVIMREGVADKMIFNLVREEIEIKNVTYYGFVPENSGNAYVKLSGFSRAAGEEIKDAIVDLQKQRKIESIVLDLRGNPGGLLDAAIDVCEKFLQKDHLVVSVVGRDTSQVKNYLAQEEPIAKDIKLALLIDGYSASAAEIVAGAIQDHDRGIIVGTKSFGKGLVQSIISLPHNSTLKMTTAKYYTPSGRCIQKIDYSRDNEVFEGSNLKQKDEYNTDEGRIVYAKGGINPDSTVNGSFESDLIPQLYAYGMFFKFVNAQIGDQDIQKFKLPGNENLYSDFVNYIEKQKFELSFEINKLLVQLKDEVAKRGVDSKLSEYISQMEKEYDSEKLLELNKYKSEILKEIKLEVVNRKEGRKGRIKAALEDDDQFEVAISLLANDKEYKRILNRVE